MPACPRRRPIVYADAMSQTLVIYGAGGHGRVVADSALRRGAFASLMFCDDQPSKRLIHGLRVLDSLDAAPADSRFLVAVGDNAARRRLTDRVRARGCAFADVVDPTAVVSASARLHEHLFVGARAVVNADVVIDEGVILNTGCIVEHDCRVGAFAHVAPGSVLGGGVSVGAGTLVGIGACVRPHVRIGAGCTVGAGAVVVKDVPDGATVVGVPAQPLR